MRISSRICAVVVASTLLAACSNGASTVVPSSSNTASVSGGMNASAASMGMWPRSGPSQRACGESPRNGFARCDALVRTDMRPMYGRQARPAAVSGYGPSDLLTAYGLAAAASSNGSGVTVAIVDAFDDPNAESDLAVYRSQYGLPACTSSNGCFTKVQMGRRTNTGWGEEEALDVDMVSAICPKCKIMLVEAASNSFSNLNSAEQYATAHANYVSNSWSGNEGSTSSDSIYTVAGKIITAATGDSGYNATAQWPAIIPSVIAVGGTHLASVSPRSESAWSGAGSGCSTVYAKPSWQTMNTGCSKRAESDTSAVGDPNTGVAVYDTFHTSGWLVFGGTSVATPIIASVYALSGNTNGNSYLYSHTSGLNDVSGGSNGNCGAPLCTSGTGWDGPTGLGTPNGLTAF